MAILMAAIALGVSVMILLKKSAKETIEPLTGEQRRWAIWKLRGIITFLVFASFMDHGRIGAASCYQY